VARGPINKLRADLAAAKEKENMLQFRMTSAEKEEKRLADQLLRLDEEKRSFEAKLAESQEKLARMEAETAARIAEVQRLAEEETRKAVEAARRETGLAGQGEAYVRSVIAEVAEQERRGDEAPRVDAPRPRRLQRRHFPLVGGSQQRLPQLLDVHI